MVISNTPVHDLAPSLLGHHVKERVSQVISDHRISHHLVTEDHQPKVIYVIYIILLYIYPVLEMKTILGVISMPCDQIATLGIRNMFSMK